MNGDSRDKIFGKLKAVIEAYSEAEEAVFYTLLRRHSATDEKVEHAIKGHDQIRKTLKDLDNMDKNDSIWLNKLMHLHDDVYQHIEEEEGSIFQKAQKNFSQQQAEEIGKEFQALKRQMTIQC